MVQVKLNIYDENKTLDLELKQANEMQKMAIISGVFGFFGSNPEVQRSLEAFIQSRKLVEAEPVPINFKIDLQEKARNEVEKAKAELHAEYSPTRAYASEVKQTMDNFAKSAKEISRKIPLLNSDRTLMTSIGERLSVPADIEEQPEWWKTGIKDKGGIPHYRCRY
ncbi:hypothetical protein PV433_30945 [Paenibacillus sp. GYB004]|uniref:hypothetical protein n=1 Tax=Paenibacillus sp. GYB004 TaxID=2994393 RepID=UPI002F96E2F6